MLTRKSQTIFCAATSLLLLMLVSVMSPGPSSAEEFEVPRLDSAVVDRAAILSASARQQLESALRQLKTSGGTQLAILTLPDLGGLTIEQASIRVTDEWKLGTAEADNGVLLLVARDERRVRIEVGQGLEGRLTDAHSKRIIDEAITPLFRQGDFDAGLTVGVYQIARLTNPELDLRSTLEGSMRPSRSSRGRRQREASPLEIIFSIVLALFVLSSRMGWLPFLFASGLGRHHYGRGHMGGGFGGGGFGGGFGGGGGGFSGGGASGGW